LLRAERNELLWGSVHFTVSNTPNFAQPSGAINSYASTPDTNGNYVAMGA
jgi:hypothetical protein